MIDPTLDRELFASVTSKICPRLSIARALWTRFDPGQAYPSQEIGRAPTLKWRPQLRTKCNAHRRNELPLPALHVYRAAPASGSRAPGATVRSARLAAPEVPVRQPKVRQRLTGKRASGGEPYPAARRSRRARAGGMARISSPVKTCSVFRSRSTTAWSLTQPPISR